MALPGSSAQVPVELSQLTLGERISEQETFDQLKRSLMSLGRGHLAHLRGHAVVVRFMQADGNSALPFRVKEAPLLLDSLKQFQPVPASERPTRLEPQVDVHRYVKDFERIQLQSAPLDGSPPGLYYRLMRSELLLASDRWISQRDAWNKFCSALIDKDNRRNGGGIVLFIAGSPTSTTNRARPGDSVLARAIVEAATREPVPEAAHLDRVWIHSWPERAVYELIPGRTGAERLCGAQFG